MINYEFNELKLVLCNKSTLTILWHGVYRHQIYCYIINITGDKDQNMPTANVIGTDFKTGHFQWFKFIWKH